MARKKARYTGDGAGSLLRDFSPELKAELRQIYLNADAGIDRDDRPDTSADEFVEVLLTEAWWVKSAMHHDSFRLTKEELDLEQRDLLKQLKGCSRALREMSLDLDRHLGFNADPLGCADAIGALIPHVEEASRSIAESKITRSDSRARSIALELTLRISRVLNDYDIKASATGDSYFGYRSAAVDILTIIGAEVGLQVAPLTWRDRVAEVKKLHPGLK